MLCLSVLKYDLTAHLVTLCRRGVPTPGDNRSSPFGSISGVPSHAVNGRSFYGVHIVQPSCYWPSPPSLPTHLPEHHIILHSAFLSHHKSKVKLHACATLDSSVHSGLMFSSSHTLVFLSIHDTLITRLQHHISNASIFFLSAFASSKPLSTGNDHSPHTENIHYLCIISYTTITMYFLK